MRPVSTFDLRAMAALLRQGRRIDTVSRGMAALAGLWLVIAATLSPASVAVLVLLLASLAAGAAQLYCAARTDFDADLLAGLAALPDPPEAAAGILDASLQRLGLQPEHRAGRNWDARWHGARGWLNRQSGLLLARALGVAGAWTMALAAGGTV